MRRSFITLAVLMFFVGGAHAENPDAGSNGASAQPATEPASSGAGTDLLIVFGSDFDRPRLLPGANYTVGIGHTFGSLRKGTLGDGLTFAYTYENGGTHGFLHTAFSERTESLRVMKNFPLQAAKRVTGYTWLQTGLTSYTGNVFVQNRLDSSESLGAVVHFNDYNSIWIQESCSKVVTVPWYTTAGIGCTWRW